MELRHLRYFSAVAQERSFTLAARRLHVSQSGVSGQVRDLEQELGVALFRREQRTVSLTPEGSAFLTEAQEILDRADRAIEMVTQAAKGRRGKLTVGLCGPATAPFLPRLIREFRRREPGILLSLKDLDPAHQPEALVNGEIDVGFTRGIPTALRGTLASEVFFRESLESCRKDTYLKSWMPFRSRILPVAASSSTQGKMRPSYSTRSSACANVLGFLRTSSTHRANGNLF